MGTIEAKKIGVKPSVSSYRWVNLSANTRYHWTLANQKEEAVSRVQYLAYL